MNQHKPYGLYERFFKRLLDFVIATIALIVLFLPMCIIGILVRVNLGTPVLFAQQRPGLAERIFKLYKFRSMTDARDQDGNFLPDSVRLTPFGRILRSTSLDELPELINIFKGDMAIVGPRPLSVKYLPYYYEEERKRHDVRPGLTGLAQVNGRNSISWEEKFKYDLDYVSKITFVGDMRIVFKTIMVVFNHKDIGQAEQAPVSLHILRGDNHHGNKV